MALLTALYIVIIDQIRKWLKNVSRGYIFTYKNAKIIILISYCFVLLGLFESIIKLAGNFAMYHFYDIIVKYMNSSIKISKLSVVSFLISISRLYLLVLLFGCLVMYLNMVHFCRMNLFILF